MFTIEEDSREIDKERKKTTNTGEKTSNAKRYLNTFFVLLSDKLVGSKLDKVKVHNNPQSQLESKISL